MARTTWKARKGERVFLSCCRRMAWPGEWITAKFKHGQLLVPTYKHRYGCRGVRG